MVRSPERARPGVGWRSALVAALVALATATPAQQQVHINKCIDARITPGVQLTSLEHYWEWRYEFTNTCTTELGVTWFNRAVSDDGWGVGQAKTVRPGETNRNSGLWNRDRARQRGYADCPPVPLVLWCVYQNQSGGSARCSGQNDYGRSPANWNQLGRY